MKIVFFYLTYLNMGTVIEGVFWLNIVENRVYLWYEYCSKLFGKLRKEREFWQHCCRNSNKKYERGKVNDVMGGGRKKFEFWQWDYWNSCCLKFLPDCQVKCLKEEWLKGNQLWKPSCWNCKGVRRDKIRIVATKLPKT